MVSRRALTARGANARAIDVDLDGEVLRMAPPLEHRILPGALRVLVPAARSERG